MAQQQSMYEALERILNAENSQQLVEAILNITNNSQQSQENMDLGISTNEPDSPSENMDLGLDDSENLDLGIPVSDQRDLGIPMGDLGDSEDYCEECSCEYENDNLWDDEENDDETPAEIVRHNLHVSADQLASRGLYELANIVENVRALV